MVKKHVWDLPWAPEILLQYVMVGLNCLSQLEVDNESMSVSKYWYAYFWGELFPSFSQYFQNNDLLTLEISFGLHIYA